MALKEKIISLDGYFASIGHDKFILNDYSSSDFRHAREFYEAMVTEYEGDYINILPKCKCGALNAEYYHGITCPKCGTKADTIQYDPVVWARAYSPDLKFINPAFFNMLNDILDKDISYLCGVTTEPRTKGNICISIGRNILHNDLTYKNFVANIRNILTFLPTIGRYKHDNKLLKVHQLLAMWDTHHDILLSQYLPMINNVLFAITKTSKGKYVDTGFAQVFDIASTWMRVANDASATQADYDRTTAKAVCTLGAMPEFYIKQYLSKKSGLFRKHVYGTRSSFTCRCVITSLPGTFKYNEIELPWVTGVSVFRPHLLNKLMKTGKYTYKEASVKIYKTAKKYDAEVDGLLKELLAESTGTGLKVIIHRNPSLLQSSALYVNVGKIKSDPTDNTIGFPQALVKGPNAD